MPKTLAEKQPQATPREQATALCTAAIEHPRLRVALYARLLELGWPVLMVNLHDAVRAARDRHGLEKVSAVLGFRADLVNEIAEGRIPLVSLMLLTYARLPLLRALDEQGQGEAPEGAP